MYLCKLVQVIYVRLLSWRLYSFFIGKNKKNLKKTLNFYVHAWNAKHPNGISVIHVIEDVMILFVFEKKNFFNCRIYMWIQSYFPSQKHSIYGGTARQNHWGGTGESGWRSKGLIRKAETLQVLRNCIRLWTTCPRIKQVIQAGLHSPLARCMKNKQKLFDNWKFPFLEKMIPHGTCTLTIW